MSERRQIELSTWTVQAPLLCPALFYPALLRPAFRGEEGGVEVGWAEEGGVQEGRAEDGGVEEGEAEEGGAEDG